MLQGADLSLLLMMNTRREEVEDDSVVGKTTSRKWMMIMVKKRATGAVSCDWRRCECTTRKETHLYMQIFFLIKFCRQVCYLVVEMEQNIS